MADGERVMLVDCDALGGGLDLLLGAEEVQGLRWPDLALSDPARAKEVLARETRITDAKVIEIGYNDFRAQARQGREWLNERG